MAELYDTVLQTIKDRCPNLNWKIGGVLRELLIEPISAMQTAVATYLSTALQSFDLQAALASPATHEDTLDVWMDRLRLSLPPKSQPKGTVALVTSELTEDLIIPIRTNMECAGIPLVTMQEQRITPSAVVKISAERYVCYVDVTCANDLTVNIMDGTPVTWSSAPEVVQDMYVSSAITGGSTNSSAQAKANAISNALNTGSVIGEEALTGALDKAFPGVVVDVKTIRNSALNRYALPLCVKPKKLPETATTAVFSAMVDSQESVQLPVDGVVAVTEVRDAEGNLVEHNVDWAGRYPVIHITTPQQPRQLNITYKRFLDIADVSSWLNSTQRLLPYQFACTTPAIVRVKLFINTGGVDIDTGTRTKIQEYICDKPLDTILSDSEITAILTDSRYTVTGSILYSAEVTYRDYHNIWSSSGILNPSGQTGLSGAPVALYSTVADIKGC